MTEFQIKKLNEYQSGMLPRDEFMKEFGEEICDVQFVKDELRKSIESKNQEKIERSISLIWFSENYDTFIDELNILLLNPNHISHQVVTKTIQDIGNVKSIPYIKEALETNFDYLKYTYSESEAIAKWFSWALYSIGTKEAIEVMKIFSVSEDSGIRNEMIYRLSKVKK